MSDHTCKAVVVTCIDFRFQKFIEEWVNINVGPGQYDRVSWAGAVFNLETVLGQIEISHRLHHIKQVILVNHEDCGAYGMPGHMKDISRI